MASIALGIMGVASAVGAIGGAAIQANAAGKASSAEQNAAGVIKQQALDAAKTASDTVNQATANANSTLGAGTDAANQVIGDTLQKQLATLKPYVDAGTLSLSELQNILSPTGALNGPGSQFGFTAKDYQNSPEFDFIKQQANQQLQRSAAAQGAGIGGGFARASDQLNTGLASTYLNDAFNRALSTYNTNRQNLLTQIQGLTNVTGLGYNATGATNQDIGNAGLTQASNLNTNSQRQAGNTIAAGVYSGDTGLKAAQIAAQAESGAANAQAAGDIASGNAWSGALSGIGNTALATYGLSQAGNLTPAQLPTSQTIATAPSSAAPTGGLSTPSSLPGTSYMAQPLYI